MQTKKTTTEQQKRRFLALTLSFYVVVLNTVSDQTQVRSCARKMRAQNGQMSARIGLIRIISSAHLSHWGGGGHSDIDSLCLRKNYERTKFWRTAKTLFELRKPLRAKSSKNNSSFSVSGDVVSSDPF